MSSDRIFKSAMVVLQLEVTPPGAPSSVVVMQSSGYPELDEAAVTAVKNLTCRSSSGNPYKTRALQHVVFDLDDGQPIYLRPDSARALAGRGSVRMYRQDFDRAKADFDEAIHQNPQYQAAYVYRAELLQRTGKDIEAIADLDQAIQLDAENARALRLRAAIKAGLGNYIEAAADHEHAMRVATVAGDYTALGRLLFYANDFVRSAESLRRGVEERPQYAYAPIWLFLATARAGNNEQAQVDLATHKTALGNSGWPIPVIDFYLGRLTPDALLAVLKDANPKMKSERLCEANFFLAENEMLHGNFAAARPLFEAAERDCPRNFVEYRGSVAELNAICVKDVDCAARPGRSLGDRGERVAAEALSKLAPPNATWCRPHPPSTEPPLAHAARQHPGWVKMQMHVHPGAVPVTDVRVLSEAGGPALPQVYLPRVRQWIGCSTNPEARTLAETFVYGDPSKSFPKEGFGLYAFQSPRGAPVLPSGDIGVGVCPISATLKLNQPQSANVVLKLDSAGGEPIAKWLAGLEPNRGYMVVDEVSNRVEFPCRVGNGGVNFFEQ